MPDHTRISPILIVHELITIGGGAAGFFGAINAAEAGASPVLILEKSKQLLGKVKISGGGRCNVTHHCFDPRELTKRYPRGEKSLIGPFHHFNATDTVSWFESRGVELKTEDDGRMFPITDSSQTIIDCLTNSARKAGVEVRTQCGVEKIQPLDPEENDGARFRITIDTGQTFLTRSVLLATGGTRLAAGAKLATSLGHTLVPNVPSLFTFKIEHPLLTDLPGLSVAQTECHIPSTKLRTDGPLLITHWGVSGPGILKLSAWGARELAELNYEFTVKINWLPGQDLQGQIQCLRKDWGKRQLSTRCPFPEIPKRLWARFLELSEIPETTLWSQLGKAQAKSLINWLQQTELPVTGKSLNKDEFVTAGGVELKEVNLKTLESKKHPGLHFAGEILNIDGITGGFNFQNAWTTAHLAAQAIAFS